MTREEKDLLLRDLCGRLPYGVKAQYYGSEEEMLTVDTIEAIYTQPSVEIVIGQYGLGIEDIKPYLRPMSSMTEEEMIVFLQVRGKDLSQVSKRFINDFKNGNFGIMANMSNYARNIDWLNKKMFDYRGLIPKDLALSTEEFNPYKY